MEDNNGKAEHPETVGGEITEEERQALFGALGAGGIPNAVVGPVLAFLGAISVLGDYAMSQSTENLPPQVLEALDFLAPIMVGMIGEILEISRSRGL